MVGLLLAARGGGVLAAGQGDDSSAKNRETDEIGVVEKVGHDWLLVLAALGRPVSIAII
jgi:hypothetical protein